MLNEHIDSPPQPQPRRWYDGPVSVALLCVALPAIGLWTLAKRFVRR